MAENRTRLLKEPEQRVTGYGGRRRITKEDGKMSKAAQIKSSAGIVIPEVRKVMLDRRRDERVKSAHRSNVIYPSEMSRSDWCHRATYYRMVGYKERESNPSFSLESVFAEGNAIHSKWQGWLSDTGLLWGDWRCSRCGLYARDCLRPSAEDGRFGSCVGTGWTNLSDLTEISAANYGYPHDWNYKEVTLKSVDLPVSGHADGALVKHDCLIELKSMGIGSLRFEAPLLVNQHTHDVNGKKIIDVEGIWKDFHRPLLGHIRQGNIYLWMAEQMGLPFDSMVFVYEFKANQQAKEFKIVKSSDILMPMLADAYMITECLDRKIVPACPFDLKGCSSCRAYEPGEWELSEIVPRRS